MRIFDYTFRRALSMCSTCSVRTIPAPSVCVSLFRNSLVQV